MEEQYSGPRTIADSAAEGRLKEGVCSHGKKKCLKCAISKNDGKGGFKAPGYGKPPARGGAKLSALSLGKIKVKKSSSSKSLLPKLGAKGSKSKSRKISLKRALRKLK